MSMNAINNVNPADNTIANMSWPDYDRKDSMYIYISDSCKSAGYKTKN